MSAVSGGGCPAAAPVIDPDPAIRIEWIGGNCPVQAKGEVGGVPFYFRARGEHWSLGVGADPIGPDAEWYYREPYGDQEYAAGWMPKHEALGFLAKALGLYAARATGAATTDGERG